MRTGMDERGRQVVLDSLISGRVPRETAGPTAGESGLGEEFVRHKSAMFGMRMALPIALCLWALIAVLMWAWDR